MVQQVDLAAAADMAALAAQVTKADIRHRKAIRAAKVTLLQIMAAAEGAVLMPQLRMAQRQLQEAEVTARHHQLQALLLPVVVVVAVAVTAHLRVAPLEQAVAALAL